MLLEDAGERLPGEEGRVGEELLLVAERLAVGAGAEGLVRDGGPVARDDVAAIGGHGVMEDRRAVGRIRVEEEVEHPLVVAQLGGHRQRRQDRLAGELVAEPDEAVDDREETALLGHGEDVGIVQQGLHPLDVRPARDDRQQLDRGARRGRERLDACDDGIGDARRHPVTGVDDLGHEEGVAGGDLQHLLGVQVRAGGQRRDRPRGEAPEPDPTDVGARQHPEDTLQRMVGPDLVVAVGHDEDASQPVDAAPDEPQHVERGLVGPVDVLEHQHRGAQRVVQLGEQRVEEGAGVGRRDHVRERAACGTCHVVERTEGAAREEVVAPADEQPALDAGLVTEGADQARLADARLA